MPSRSRVAKSCVVKEFVYIDYRHPEAKPTRSIRKRRMQTPKLYGRRLVFMAVVWAKHRVYRKATFQVHCTCNARQSSKGPRVAIRSHSLCGSTYGSTCEGWKDGNCLLFILTSYHRKFAFLPGKALPKLSRTAGRTECEPPTEDFPNVTKKKNRIRTPTFH